MMWRKMSYRWRQAVVLMVVCGGLGLTLYKYCKISLRPYTDYRPVDPIHISHSLNSQGLGYAENEGHRSNNVREEGSASSHPQQNGENTLDDSSSTSVHGIESFIEQRSHSHSDKNEHKESKHDNETFNTADGSPTSASATNMTKSLKMEEGQGKNRSFMTDVESNSLSKADENKKQNKISPRVILLLTRWRSGSTFLGELLAKAVPQTFYSYEPLFHWGIRVLEEDDNSTREAVVWLKDLFQCDMETHAQQVNYLASLHFYLQWNTHLSSQCSSPLKKKKLNGKKAPSMKQPPCSDASFVSDVCRHSALHVAKVVRLSLRQAVPLLEDKNLPLQVVYLVRDPRAILSSGSTLPWCTTADCKDPYTVCTSLHQDLLLLPNLLRRFPDRLKMVFYEEFLHDLPDSLRDLLAFLHMAPAPSHLKYLNVSTQGSPVGKVTAHENDPYSTSRNLAHQALMWRVKTPYKKAVKYQEACKDVLTSLGLREFTSLADYNNYSLPALLPRPRRPLFINASY